MSVEENKDIVRRWILARNTNDLDLALSLWDEAWQIPLEAGFQGITNAFPDLNISIEALFGEGDLVALSATLRATHSGVYQNIPPTQKQIELATIDIYT